MRDLLLTLIQAPFRYFAGRARIRRRLAQISAQALRRAP
jgi:hypothetical protein